MTKRDFNSRKFTFNLQTFKPHGDQVLIQVTKVPDQTKGGIWKPESAKERANTGLIISIGDGQITNQGVHIPCKLSIDDEVVFSEYAGTNLEFEGEEGDYKLIKESLVWGILNSKE